MRFSTIILGVFWCLLFSSNLEAQISKKEDASSITNCELPSIKEDKNALWACYISTNNMDSLSTIYASNAIKVRANGEVFKIADAIENYYSKKEVGIKTIKTLYKTKANYLYDYEIGTFTLENGDAYKHVVIWNKAKYQKREFEFISKAEEAIPLDSQIEIQRQQWIELCNAHNSEALVNALYTPNTVYYNHKPVVIGLTDLAREYSYMNNQKYALNLTPLHLEMVTSNLAYEIGQCNGSYNGKYIIIWQKDTEGKWKVLVDSNI